MFKKEKLFVDFTFLQAHLSKIEDENFSGTKGKSVNKVQLTILGDLS